MYDEKDHVFVVIDNQLQKKPFVIEQISDDQEQFTVKGTNNNGITSTYDVPRDSIMYGYEVDKLGVILVQNSAVHIEQASDNDDINDYVNGKDPEYATVIPDATLDGIVQDLVGGFPNIKIFNQWFLAHFSHYSPNAIYCLDGTYYIVLAK